MVYESMNHANDVTCHAVLVILFLVFREKKKNPNVVVKNKSTTIFHGLHSYHLSTFYDFMTLVSQTSFGGETSGSIAKCRLYSQASVFTASCKNKDVSQVVYQKLQTTKINFEKLLG